MNHQLTFQLWNQPVGLLITAIATLVLTNSLNLESISTAGSVGFLLIFAVVNQVGFRLADKIGGNKVVPAIGFVLCAVALIVLVQQQFMSNKLSVIISVSIVVGCFVVEWAYKRTEKGSVKTPSGNQHQ
ncbi:hypothetical protein LVD17_16495 [Fulvivirga ulvae]|uniref:hypothetical protein n=1 Tax=Fulvivirga ulvae TaxID=2904245 RepID=UPI001F2DF015|nr:hypothetical protein [Fulvivirga ulvae]UII29898.1 hypothetical protein LVD17_16495 [Fulvivirga ulvae]